VVHPFTGPDNAGWVKAADQVSEELQVPLAIFGLGSDLSPVDETITDLLQRYGLEPSGALLHPAGWIRRLPLRRRADDEYQPWVTRYINPAPV